MTADKQQLRRDLLARHDAISDKAVRHASETTRERLLEELQKRLLISGTAHVYSAPSKWKEIITQQLVQDMKAVLDYDIDQPDTTPDAPMSDQKYDVVIVPCLGFDNECNRIGRGRGWYDRFLSTQPQALKVGLAFDAMHCEDIPLESHDVRLDMVVTELAVYTSQGK